MLPVARRALRSYANTTRNGVYVTPSTGLNWHPSDTAPGEDAHSNATLFRALRGAADLERWAGRGSGAARGYDRRAASLRRGDDRAAVGRTGRGLRGQPQRSAAQPHPGRAGRGRLRRRDEPDAVAPRAAVHQHPPAATARGRQRRVRRRPLHVELHLAVHLLHRAARAAAVRRRPGRTRRIRRTWGHMLTAGPGTLWEKVAFDGLPANYVPLQKPVDPFSGGNLGAGWVSLAHGWGGGPVPALSGYVLGIRPTAPGFRRWIVAPAARRPALRPGPALPPRTAPSRPAGRAGRAAAPSSSRSPRPAARAGSSTCPCSAGAARSRWTAGSCGTAGVIAAGPAPGRRAAPSGSAACAAGTPSPGRGRSMTRRGVRPSLVLLAGVGGTWAATGASPAMAGPRARERA